MSCSSKKIYVKNYAGAIIPFYVIFFKALKYHKPIETLESGVKEKNLK